MNILVKNGFIIDGTGKKGFNGDIAIKNEKISAIAAHLDDDGYDKIIDAQGRVVAPGFIDTHSHSDLELFIEPYLSPKVFQGITTEILGQDGISMAPLPEKYISPWRKNLAGLDGDSDDIDWHYKTTEGYLKNIEKSGVSINEGYLVPHGNVRMEAIGLDNVTPNDEELKKMCDILRREMQAGAFGLSTGLIYMPCAYSNTKEIVELCKVVAEFDGVFVIHQRSEADTIIDSMKEVIEIGRQSGVKVHFSHFKVCGRKNWHLLDKVIELLEQAKAEGIHVSFDQYPYVAGSTMLGVILPPWAHDGGTDKLIKRLEDPKLRLRMINDIKNGIPGWDNFIDFAGLDQIFVTSVKTKANEDLVGKSLVEIGKMRGKDPYQATFDLLHDEENAVGMVDFYGKEEHIIRLMKRPEQNVCTDGLLGGKPHPRVYGAFPRVLGKYVREEKQFTIEEAIHKMSGRPAQVFRIKNRGTLSVGNYADIVVFDQNIIADKGTFVNPAQYAVGMEYIMVNGELIVENAKQIQKKPGQVLRMKA